MKKSQNGFVLISVLLITTISTVYALSEIKGNQLQERIGGNQQKEMNARLMAEKGIFDAIAYIKIQQAASATLKTIATNIIADVSQAEYTLSQPLLIDTVTPNTLSFVSTGKVDGAVALLKAKLNIASGLIPPTFGSGIVGCNGVVLKASASSDSYDSRKGNYGDTVDGVVNIGANGDVATLMEGADVVLGGSGTVKGSVASAANTIVNGSSKISGGINANGNVDLYSNSSGLEVGGAINSGGNVFTTNNAVGDNITANGRIEQAGRLATGKVATENSGVTDIVDIETSGECDNKGYAIEYYKDNGSGTPTKAYGSFASNGALLVNGSEVSFTSGNFSSVDNAISGAVSTESILDTPENVHVFDSFTLNVNQKIKVSGGGDVFIVVKNEFLMKSSSAIEVEKGTTLTFLVAGTIKTDALSEINEVARSVDPTTAVTDASRSVVEFYSVHEDTTSTPGAWNTGNEHYIDSNDQSVKQRSRNDADFKNMLSVNMQGNKTQATVHAPRGHVEVNSAGGFYGAIRGKTAYVNGNGAIHYDEKLRKSSGGGPPIVPTVSYSSIHYIYK